MDNKIKHMSQLYIDELKKALNNMGQKYLINLFHDNVKFYRTHFYTNAFSEYRKIAEEERKKNHEEYVMKNKPQWENRVDYFEYAGDACIVQVKFLDVLSNDGISKLIKKLYNLPQSKYDVRNYYKKPTLFNSYDYVHYNYAGYYCGILSHIIIKNDEYIRDVDISITQLNSYYAVLEYSFEFRRCLTPDLYDRFIFDKIEEINPQKDFYAAFKLSENEQERNMLIEEMHKQFFPLICQHFITSVLFSEQGKNNKLINLTLYTRAKPVQIDRMYLGDMTVSYYNKKENYFITSIIGEADYYLYIGDNRIPNFSFIHYLGKYGNHLYTMFFGIRELKIFEESFSKYASERKKVKYNHDFYSLLRKAQSFSSVETEKKEGFFEEFGEKWDFYCCNDKQDIKEYYSQINIDLRKVYKENFDYLRIHADIFYANSNRYIALSATFIAFVSLVVTILNFFRCT